jgi:drug/metabolite transporter (DMT)-like permease
VAALTATAWQDLPGALPLLAASAILERAAPVLWTPRFVAGLLVLGLVGSAGPPGCGLCLFVAGELIWLNALTLLTPALPLLLALVLYRGPLRPSGLVRVAAVLGSVTWLGWPRGSRRGRASSERR